MEKEDKQYKYIAEGKKYKDILTHYGCDNIATTLSNYSVYDLMFTISWIGGPGCSRFYEEYEEAKKDSKKMDEVIEMHTKRAKQLLEDSGYEEKQVDEMLPDFTQKIMSFYCWPGGLNLIYRDYSKQDLDIDRYHEEYLEALNKKDIDKLPYTIKNNGDELEYLKDSNGPRF